MDEHFGVPIDSLIKLVVGNLGVLDADLVRYDETRLCPAGNDQVAEIAVVGLDVALTGTERETLK